MSLLGYLKNVVAPKTVMFEGELWPEDVVAHELEYRAWKQAQQAPPSAEKVDRSTDDNVVQYAVITLMKGKSPASAAKSTAKKLSGGQNMFLGPGISIIDPDKLEKAIYEYLMDFSFYAGQKPGGRYGMLNKHPAPYTRVEVENFTSSTLQHFRQLPAWGDISKSQLAVRNELLKRTLAKLGDSVQG